ncbi:hypothetical protein D3OALGA1CA_2199 [Olavius algarvensis associated proteobacterium Delta 3]|nr:hypothetical protein D3OALGA1CA_2199 [Olavius algarvensis associated proteobacterium Delta 3]
MGTLFRIILLGMVLAGCATPDPRVLQRSLEAGDCASAPLLLEQEKGKYGGNSELLFLMDAGMVHLQCGNYGLAQEQFREAEQLAEALWTKSLSRNAAFIDYLLAARAYIDYNEDYGTPMPESLQEDLLRTGVTVDRLEDAEAVLKNFPGRQWTTQTGTGAEGKIVYIQFSGNAPEKVEDRVYIPTRRGPVTIAFPRMVMAPPTCGGGRLVLRSGAAVIESDLELVEDINRIALKNLDDRKGRVIAKTVARAVAKQVVIAGLSSQGDDDMQATIATVLNLINMAVERADTRSWRTLPGEIYMTRIFVPPGVYTLGVSGCGEPRQDLRTLRIESGHTRYVLHDSRYGLPKSVSNGQRH